MRIEYDITAAEQKRAAAIIAANRPAEIGIGKTSSALINSLRTIFTFAILLSAAAAYTIFQFMIEDFWIIGGLIFVCSTLIGYLTYSEIRKYQEIKRSILMPISKSNCIEVHINEIFIIENGVRAKFGRYDVKNFLNTQDFFLIYLASNRVIIIPPSAFRTNESRENFKAAINEIIQGNRLPPGP